MLKKKYSIKEFIIMALMVSLGIVLQIVDNMLNFTAVPGGKLGLTNIVSLKNIFLFGGSNALIISVIRVVIASFLYGGVSALPYSFSGAFFSIAAMVISKKLLYPKLSEVGISIIGAFFHNLAQVLIACLVFESTKILSYMAPLTVVSVFSGLITGMQVKIINQKF